jgi:hypothetical protein
VTSVGGVDVALGGVGCSPNMEARCIGSRVPAAVASSRMRSWRRAVKVEFQRVIRSLIHQELTGPSWSALS